MIVYHGTTYRAAQQIHAEGFVPKKPSRLVWFARSRRYATGRAKTKARRARDRAVVLTCDLDLGQLRREFGTKRVRCRNNIIAIDGSVPPTVLCCCGAPIDQPSSPKDLADWVNTILGLKPHKGVGRSHPGIERLSRWVTNRVRSRPKSKLRPGELLQVAQQWLPEYFEDVEVDPDTLHVFRKVTIDPAQAEPRLQEPAVDERANEALGLLDDPKPKSRVRGLAVLEKIQEPDLFDWCAMYLDDESTEVRVAALHTMLKCEEGDGEAIEQFAESEDKRIRAAAIAALAKHSGEEAPRWVERGLKDPSPCVRLEASALLSLLDPEEHRSVFELALYDGNPQVAHRAQKLTHGKGYGKPSW